MPGHLSSGLGADLRFALRSPRQRRGISLAILAPLTLGIGATSAWRASRVDPMVALRSE